LRATAPPLASAFRVRLIDSLGHDPPGGCPYADPAPAPLPPLQSAPTPNHAIHNGGYGYSRWCELCRSWEARLSSTMRQVHAAGERLFVDYAGQTVEVADSSTGELRTAQVFIAVLGAPN
jgi:hypothetical protein